MPQLPLHRRYITTASQVMLPAYALTYLTVGALFCFQDPSRTTSGAFAYAKILAPITMWGVLFTVIGMFMVFTMAVANRKAMVAALVLGVGLAGFWAFLLFRAAADSPLVSYTSGVWVALAGVAQFASGRSLRAGET